MDRARTPEALLIQHARTLKKTHLRQHAVFYCADNFQRDLKVFPKFHFALI